MIAIVGAMDEEIKGLKSIMKNIDEIKIAGMVFYKGSLEEKEIILVKCGIGKVNAALCTSILAQSFNVSKIIFTGVAGGINPDLNIGDIVISKDLIQHDFDTTAFGSKPGQIPRMDEYIFKANEELVKLALEVENEIKKEGQKVILGRILSGDQFINSIEKIQNFRKVFNGDCVEMEGASLAHIAYLYSIDFLVIRAISDKADHSANVNFNEFVNIAAENSKEFIIRLLRKI